MASEQWSDVEGFLDAALVHEDDALKAATRASREAGLPLIAVSPSQGKLLHILARGIGARRALELGTLGGYSAIWIARALGADGKLVTLEVDQRFADVAQVNIAGAGLSDTVEIRVGNAIDLLPRLAAEGAVFDFMFIDADKARMPEYFEWAVRLSRPGALIVVDNVVRDGRVIDAQTADPNVRGVRRFISQLSEDRRVAATAVQTVGSRGYDGFLLAMVLAGG